MWCVGLFSLHCVLLWTVFQHTTRMVLGQYIQCPAEDWTVGSTITLRCYLPKDIYPARCLTAFGDEVHFFKEPFIAANTKCTLSSVSTSSCSSTSSDCSCESGNSTHYSLQSTFTVDTEDAGTWNCQVNCFDASLKGQLTHVSDNCENKNVVVHAELSTPTITVTTPTTGSRWTVNGSVDITRIFSSAGQYPCVWSVRKDSGSYTDIINKAATIDPLVSGTSVRTGHCDFPDRPLSSAPGTYTYRVTVSPGHTSKTDSSGVVARPSADPMVSCNDQNSYIHENTPMKCNCTASDLGQPQGRLVVYRDNAQRVPGNYGESSVQFGESSVSSSDNNAVYRCVLDWATADNQDRDTTYTLKVALSSVQLTLNSQTGLLQVQENDTADVAFQCVATATPPASLLLSDDQGRELARFLGSTSDVTAGQSVLAYTMRKVRCENSAIYTCTADNGVGNTASSTVTLRVLCDLRILSNSFTSQVDGIPALDASKGQGELRFQILTTETVRTVSFLYLGSDSTGVGYPPTLGLLSVTCEQTSVTYRSTCVLTAANVTGEQNGYYSVTMATGSHSVVFTFLLQTREYTDSTPAKDDDGLSFGVGVGVGLAILAMVLILIGVVTGLCVWRRQLRQTCVERPSHQSMEERSRGVETSLEMTHDTSVAASDTGPYEELKHSDIGIRSVYTDLHTAPVHSSHPS